jgi:signal transduction histidine kinase
MYLSFVFIDVFSLVFQVAAAILAVRLIRITGENRAWIVIAAAMLAMAVRRLGILIGVLVDPASLDLREFWSDTVSLLIAILMLVGIAAIGPLFRAVQLAKEATQKSRDQLEKDVQERTADLVRAHAELKEEFAQRAKAEVALRDEHRRLLQVLEMCERDQQLLAYEIHDGFVQPATAALMNLQASLPAHKTDPDQALENVIRGLQLIQESISQVRWLISGLRPVVLEELGLVAAIEKLVDDTENRTEIPIGWSHQVQFGRLAPPLETAIFRIIQEALRNAVRHSRTKRIEIGLTQTGGNVIARVQDWGCGFDAAVSKPNHFGLEGMQQRARLFGGATRIQSAPGEGTCVTVELPLIENEAKAIAIAP